MNSVSYDPSAKLRTLRRLAYATTVAVFITVAAGSFVRAAGAGLGCHSWPKCFEWSWFPPTSVDQIPEAERASISIPKAWIEYLNRLVGVALGILTVATWITAYRVARKRTDIFPALGWALFLVLAEGALGGAVVRLKLDPRIVSVHLFGGLALALIMVAVTMNAARSEPFVDQPAGWSTARTRFHRFTWALLSIVIGNEIVGALVRGTIEKDVQPRTDLVRSQWIEQLGFVYIAHRELALVTLILVILGVFLAVKLKEEGSERVVKAAALSSLLAFSQIFAGIALAYRALPPAAQVIHVTCGILLVGCLFRQAIVTRRLA